MEYLNIDFVGPHPGKGYVLVLADTLQGGSKFSGFLQLMLSKPLFVFFRNLADLEALLT
jgi:hypothetical protein